MTDPYKHSGGDTEGAVNPDTDNLRAKSDALLKLCGWGQGSYSEQWYAPTKAAPIDEDDLPHPYANAQDAIDLAAAKGLKVMNVEGMNDGSYRCFVAYPDNLLRQFCREGPTIAEAICAAITEAMK